MSRPWCMGPRGPGDTRTAKPSGCVASRVLRSSFQFSSVKESLAVEFPASRARPEYKGGFVGQAESKLHMSLKYFLLPGFSLLPEQLLILVPKALTATCGSLVC